MHVEVKGVEQDVFVVNPGFLKLRHLQVPSGRHGRRTSYLHRHNSSLKAAILMNFMRPHQRRSQ